MGISLVDIADNTLALEVASPYAFTPKPPYTFRRVLLSCIRCYWLALIATCSPEELEELAVRLSMVRTNSRHPAACLSFSLSQIPPYGDRIPQFDGDKCVTRPGRLSAREYEGLMRTVHLVLLGIPRLEGDIRDTWEELGEVGVQTWEEND